MRSSIIIILLALLISSCKSETNKSYRISGNAPSVYNGIRVYLKTTKDNKQVSVDTTMVMNHSFIFGDKKLNPGLYFLYVDNMNGSLPVIINNETITIKIDSTNIRNSKIEDSETNSIYSDYIKELRKQKENLNTIRYSIRKANYAKNEDLIESLNLDYKLEEEKIETYGYNFIKANSENIIALVVLEMQFKRTNFNPEKFIEAFETLDTKLKNSEKGRFLFTKAQNLIQTKKKEEATKIGNVAPNFEAPSTDGKLLSLDNVKGKVTIIDFWAAWCGPCRKENPNVVKIYEQYHKDGLEIIGVSLDGNRTQKDAKKAWLDAIEKDNLTWHQVSNLNYFNDTIAKLYNVTAIPATFILDEQGKIVAKNLRGKALEQKVKELLNK